MARTSVKKPVRGEALVEEVIAHIERVYGGQLDGAAPRPLAPSVLRALRLPDGRPLPPSLSRWLAFDAGWLDVFTSLPTPAWKPRRLSRLVEEELGGWGDVFARDFEPQLPAACLLLPIGSESRRFLYLGAADDVGEYPVLYVDVDDNPIVGLLAPGFDGYLALAFGLWPAQGVYGEVPRAYAGAMRRQAELNLGGQLHLDLDAAVPARGGPDATWYDVWVFGDLGFRGDRRLVDRPSSLPGCFGESAKRKGTVADTLNALRTITTAELAGRASYFLDVVGSHEEVRLRGLFHQDSFRVWGDTLVRLALSADGGDVTFYLGQGTAPVSAYRVKGGRFAALRPAEAARAKKHSGYREVNARHEEQIARCDALPRGLRSTLVVAPVAGTVSAIDVEVGDDVSEGHACATLESMGMEMTVEAPTAGRVSSIACKEGQPVDAGDVLLRLDGAR